MGTEVDWEFICESTGIFSSSMKYAAGDSLIFDYYLNLLYVGYFFMESLFQRRDNLKFNGFRSERIALLELAGNSNQNFNIN